MYLYLGWRHAAGQVWGIFPHSTLNLGLIYGLFVFFALENPDQHEGERTVWPQIQQKGGNGKERRGAGDGKEGESFLILWNRQNNFYDPRNTDVNFTRSNTKDPGSKEFIPRPSPHRSQARESQIFPHHFYGNNIHLYFYILFHMLIFSRLKLTLNSISARLGALSGLTLMNPTV